MLRNIINVSKMFKTSQQNIEFTDSDPIKLQDELRQLELDYNQQEVAFKIKFIELGDMIED